MNAEPTVAPIELVAVWHIHPSPENAELYRPVDPSDPATVALADSIEEHGVLEPLVLTQDGYIISGHRRFTAAVLAGLTELPCRVEPIRRVDDPDGFIRLLREHNRQRIKSLDELLREAVVEADPDVAYESLLNHRRRNSGLPDSCTLERVAEREVKKRSAISEGKTPMLMSAISILANYKPWWPVSVRKVHYAVMNDPPLLFTKRPNSRSTSPDRRYENTKKCCDDLSNIILRAQLMGEIPWEAICDETRPVTLPGGYHSIQDFIREQKETFLQGYWRDYQRSQPNHIEIVGEKHTLKGILDPIARVYQIPMTFAHGYCSGSPRHDLAVRFEKSGKEKLVILLLADHDPDGENIAESFARSMRDDFKIKGVQAFYAALTADQVREWKLIPKMTAKPKATRRKEFVAKHGENVFELEAIEPEDLQGLLEHAILSVIDKKALNAEKRAEKKDAAFLYTARQRALLALRDLT